MEAREWLQQRIRPRSAYVEDFAYYIVSILQEQCVIERNIFRIRLHNLLHVCRVPTQSDVQRDVNLLCHSTNEDGSINYYACIECPEAVPGSGNRIPCVLSFREGDPERFKIDET